MRKRKLFEVLSDDPKIHDDVVRLLVKLLKGNVASSQDRDAVMSAKKDGFVTVDGWNITVTTSGKNYANKAWNVNKLEENMRKRKLFEATWPPQPASYQFDILKKVASGRQYDTEIAKTAVRVLRRSDNITSEEAKKFMLAINGEHVTGLIKIVNNARARERALKEYKFDESVGQRSDLEDILIDALDYFADEEQWGRYDDMMAAQYSVEIAIDDLVNNGYTDEQIYDIDSRVVDHM